VEPLTPAENPLLRKYYLAKRDGNRFRLRADSVADALGLGLEFTYADFDYMDSELGLRGNVDRSVAADLQYQPLESLSFTFFSALQLSNYSQAGSSTYSEPDWLSTGEERTVTLAVGAQWRPKSDPWELAAELTWTDSTSALRVGGTDYPQIAAKWLTLNATLAHRFSARTTAQLRWWLEQLRMADQWPLDGVDQNTISNVIALGEGAFEGNAQAVTLAVRHRF
jgi:hypothetical protein